MTWLALTESAAPGWADWRSMQGASMDSGTLVLEIVQPRPGPMAATLIRNRFAPGRGLRLSMTEDGGVDLLHRGTNETRMRLDRAVAADSRRVRFGYAWDRARNESRLWAEDLDSSELGETRLAGAVALPLDDARALMATAGERDGSLLWHGLSTRVEPQRVDAALGAQTQVATASGMVAAAGLRAGMRVVTADHGLQTLVAARTYSVPARGGRAPVCLRAPYFGGSRDTIVSANQGVVIGGAEVEYLFGVEEVVIRARDLIDGQHAYPVSRVPFVQVTELVFEQPEIVFAGGQLVSTAAETARPALRGYEAAALGHLRRHHMGKC